MHPTCSIEVMEVTGSVTGLYCTYVYYKRKKYAARIRNAKKVRHLLALQPTRAAACLTHPLPPFSSRVGRRKAVRAVSAAPLAARPVWGSRRYRS